MTCVKKIRVCIVHAQFLQNKKELGEVVGVDLSEPVQVCNINLPFLLVNLFYGILQTQNWLVGVLTVECTIL